MKQAAKQTNFFSKLYILAGFFLAVLYILSSLTPFINPQEYWVFTFLGLGFPIVLCIFLGYLFFLLFIRIRWVLFFIIILLLGYKNIAVVFAFHPTKKFDVQQRADIRLLSWNVNDFLDNEFSTDNPNSKRRAMLAFIKAINADVLCFQDFANYTTPQYLQNLNYIKDSLGYAYSYFPIDYTESYNGITTQYGCVVFSKLPIIKSETFKHWSMNDDEKIIATDILIHKKIIRFYTAHLRSMSIHTENNFGNNFLKYDKALLSNAGTIKTLKYFDRIHIDQAQRIKSILDTTTIPYVFCGDLNAVPSSYSYHILHNNLKDAFLQNGFGFGRTYDSLSPTLRIDPVFLNSGLTAKQHQTPTLHLSDHFPNIVDISIP
jgi:endonuclease/exonuclease/phosphatase family metal-dependent hydrolase